MLERSIYLYNRVSFSCLNRPSAALCLIMSPVVGLGVNLDLQLKLVKMAGQRPVQRRGGQGPRGRDNRYVMIQYCMTTITLLEYDTIQHDTISLLIPK